MKTFLSAFLAAASLLACATAAAVHHSNNVQKHTGTVKVVSWSSTAVEYIRDNGEVQVLHTIDTSWPVNPNTGSKVDIYYRDGFSHDATIVKLVVATDPPAATAKAAAPAVNLPAKK